jgi:glucosamine--fructose-6-phosphate aminotransferase (isomerizing)
MNFTDISSEQHSHTLKEILSQPSCWSECLRQLAESEELRSAAKLANPSAEWLLIGCGSSYYLALAAASTFNHLGLPARAVPASEVLLYPDLHLPKRRHYVPVVISRSGLTSEALTAARMLEKEQNVRTIAVTCAEGQPLESLATVTLKLPAADEKSVVMTRSFTSMLLALQYLAATVGQHTRFRDGLLGLPGQVSPLLHELPVQLREFVETHNYADYVFLAQGPLFGIANEAMLKAAESSSSYTQVFHSMEFRHGPKSIAGPGTFIVFFISESSYEAEFEVLMEMRKLGSATMVVANVVDGQTRKAADFSIELRLDTPEYARVAAYAIWGQLIGVYTGLKKGLNPDSPKNLSRAVILDGQH